jgi:hypothetical protein
MADSYDDKFMTRAFVKVRCIFIYFTEYIQGCIYWKIPPVMMGDIALLYLGEEM